MHCRASENLDIYKTWTGVHGPPNGPGPWTTPWTRFMDPVHGPSPWTQSMDPVHGPPHGPPLIFKRKSPLLIWKFIRGQDMKNTDYYSFLISLRVCLVIVGCFGIAPHKLKSTDSFWDAEDLVHICPQRFHSNNSKLQFEREHPLSPIPLIILMHKNKPIYFTNEVYPTNTNL